MNKTLDVCDWKIDNRQGDDRTFLGMPHKTEDSKETQYFWLGPISLVSAEWLLEAVKQKQAIGKS